MNKIIKKYESLCDEYINNNIQNICSLQQFLQSKYNTALKASKYKKAYLLKSVILYAENDF